MVQHKVAKRKGGSSYTYKLCSMEKLLHERESELERVELEQQQLEWKELVSRLLLSTSTVYGADGSCKQPEATSNSALQRSAS